MKYTEGICSDGVAILKDGIQMSVSEVLSKLNGVECDKLICVNCGGSYSYKGKRAICENGCNHPDGSLSYMCDSEWCRCKQ